MSLHSLKKKKKIWNYHKMIKIFIWVLLTQNILQMFTLNVEKRVCCSHALFSGIYFTCLVRHKTRPSPSLWLWWIVISVFDIINHHCTFITRAAFSKSMCSCHWDLIRSPPQISFCILRFFTYTVEVTVNTLCLFALSDSLCSVFEVDLDLSWKYIKDWKCVSYDYR